MAEAPTALAGFDDLSLERLRLRRSAKWAKYPPDVLPAWVAEMDFALAPAITRVLHEAADRGDAGYADATRLGEAFAGFADARFGWRVDPQRIWPVADVMSGVAEVIRALTGPGEAVAINPPVYPPFFGTVREIGRRVVEAPLAASRGGWELDLDALEAAFADGARAYLLCHPHNPIGRPFTPGELGAVAALAARYDVLVVADEIHAPMTLPGATHVPYLPIGSEVGRCIALVGTSKAWNIAGLKCAMIVAGSSGVQDELTERFPKHVQYHVGHLGVLASIAALEDGRPWLDTLVEVLARNRRRLAELLEEKLPEIVYTPPEAGYLAWLDCRALDLGDDPTEVFLERGRVALTPGPAFGAEGKGFARLNFGTSADLLAEAVTRMACAVGR